MEEHFAEIDAHGSEEFRRLQTRSDARSATRFATQYALLLGSVVVVCLASVSTIPMWLALPGGVTFSIMTAGMFAATHETGHRTAFRSRWANDLVCFLAALPTLYTPTGFRAFHFEHHRQTHIPGRDPELSFGHRPVPGATDAWPSYLAFLTGVPIVAYKLAMLLSAALVPGSLVWREFLTWVPERDRDRLRWESRFVLLVHGAALALGYLYVPGILWLIAAQIAGHGLLAVFIMAEHGGLPHDGPILEKTRSTRTNSLVRWLLWNMPFHAEHHAWPSVPWHALPALHSLVAPRIVHETDGYPAFHTAALGAVLSGRPYREAASRAGTADLA